ncbi:hypothetical protein C448_00977 [Halococcus morrhuae DSM 1307]|uniref:Uncharacterized protein n=1 Tax=Halococcus morrhuae DSM 1307 TaxID=931277 RepID=M0N0G8_HALMO|nr:hypothetical protein [Halococcus morrhuae]EMA51371.1 hypothetical protein C448_00977 [Halococcus morrhuae DSM 1307]
MSDPSGRERAMAALGTLSSVLAPLLVLAVFAVAAIAVAVFVFDPLMFQAAAGSPGSVVADEASVFESTTSAAGCTPNASDNASIEGYRLLGARHLEITGNVSLPDAADRLTEPTITRRSPGTFVLSIDHRGADAANRSCRGLARYTAKVQLPYGVTDYEFVVRHGTNRTLRVIERS